MKEHYDFRAGEVLLVDKPLGWTSFDVVNKLRWKIRKLYGVKKFKVGHAGTLDPLATGLLIICTGRMTKKSQDLMADDKTYTGTILLGKTTPSFDLETEYDQTFSTENIDKTNLESITQSFVGEQLQTPPIYSAKKIDGKRAYESARAGKTVEMRQNVVHIHDFQINVERFPEIDFTITCSKGTYIRSIAHDFGKALNNGGTLVALRRITSGSFKIENTKSVEEWLTIIENTKVDFK